MGDFLKKAYDDAEQNQKPAKTSGIKLWPEIVGTFIGTILGILTYYLILQPILF